MTNKKKGIIDKKKGKVFFSKTDSVLLLGVFANSISEIRVWKNWIFFGSRPVRESFLIKKAPKSYRDELQRSTASTLRALEQLHSATERPNFIVGIPNLWPTDRMWDSFGSNRRLLWMDAVCYCFFLLPFFVLTPSSQLVSL